MANERHDYSDTLGPHITREEASKSAKTHYEHPVTGKKNLRMTREQYDSAPNKEFLHAGATPYGAGHNMSHHGEGKKHGE